MKKKIGLLFVLLLAVVLPSLMGMKADAAAGWMNTCKPYQYTSVEEYLPTEMDSFKVGGREYFEGYVFYCWYQTSLSQVLYNLDGKYSSFSFDVGRVDGTNSMNSKLFIYLDGMIAQTVDLSPSDLSKRVTVNLNGAKHMKIVCQTQGHKYDVYYGIFNGQWTTNGSRGTTVGASTWLDTCPPYDISDTERMMASEDKGIYMGGKYYTNAISFYRWNPYNNPDNDEATVKFNLDGQYETFTFTVGHIDGETRANAELYVRLDGKTAKKVVMNADDLPQRVSVSVAGAKQMILELTAETEPLNTYDIYYGVGEAVLKSNGKVTGLSLDKSSISLTKKGQTASLKAQISPSDATNKTVKWTSSKTSVAKVSSSGVVTAVGNGTATITATSADGGFKATCKVTVTLPNLRNATISIAKSTYAYTGKALKPTVTVKYNGKKLRKNSDYTVSYKNNTKVGKATITVKGKGNYTGSKTKTFAIKIDTSKAYTVGNIKYKITSTSKKTAQVVGLKSAKKSTVTIPSTVKILGTSYKVTRIYAKAFQKNKYLKTLVIGANVQTIDGKAFYGCSKLSRICVKGKVLKSVGANALRGTKSKVRVEVPRKYYSKYKKLFTNKGQTKIQFVKK
ncbi:MAG TPA: NPCBM/NEW2 domain-containing protein [Candidatus Limivivens intestinipullorum]|uniref:NPCBM/NEW2 domain-containing protein n=1 Tax=Candidatus Limivivens intestinipullorum TaxID=2840858 RepID=A0A9D1JL89_9FIRM|nr:NPCBM/NEW2 domain-containing protein [Candidatus Limivivens intestinipullorum]